MGCFSFICKECDTPIRYKTGNGYKDGKGEKCRLFLIRSGKVIDHMCGEYDNYGRVKKPRHWFSFIDDMFLGGSQQWKLPWGTVCDIMHKAHYYEFKKKESYACYAGDGIAAIHQACYRSIPTSASQSDPDQGEGELRSNYC